MQEMEITSLHLCSETLKALLGAREGGRKRESRKGKKKEERKERRKEEERVSKQNKSMWGRLSGHVAATLSGVHVHCLPQEHHSFPLQTLVLLLPSFVVKPEQ